MEPIKLGELAPGMLFKKGDTYVIKSEYRTEKGLCEAYIIGSGEMFYGGTGNPNALKVEPIDFDELIEKANSADQLKELNIQKNFTIERQTIEIEDLQNQLNELETFKNHAEFLLSEHQFNILEEQTKAHLEQEKALTKGE